MMDWAAERLGECVKNPLDYPLLIFVSAFLLLWLAAWVGSWLSQRRNSRMAEDERSDFGTIQAATLTLLGLIIGFSFSMATGRYDQRKTYEEAEANAIGTEYVRADLLPQENAARVRTLLKQYTDLRIAFYGTRDLDELARIDRDTAAIQNQLWTTVSEPNVAQPSPLSALTLSGMNDVLNSQGYTQSAWWNRIPVAAWALMFGIAIFSNGLLGYGTRRMEPRFFMVLPLVVAVSFLLIADIDSPRGGVIRVHPQNLVSLQGGLK
jgi:lipopolysaccharide export LptBFGC system permease protein LptF